MIWSESIITVTAPMSQGMDTIMAMGRTSPATDITMGKGRTLRVMAMNMGTVHTRQDMDTIKGMAGIIRGMVGIITVTVDFINKSI
ncbi:hypothetical protein SAMN05421677_105203 [Halobacillus aidingensis]|uniref:Uncharacterized protein n=1 Tax=Halobacillus aidingensis TaxID=240303 RepID=A0A1H0K2D1_HALAD|nr:hypothetical protein SAMN05421677_105203 [Halobacillus aidingensis]